MRIRLVRERCAATGDLSANLPAAACRYKREEILGRNCRFLQGPGTDRRAVKEIRQTIDAGQECTVRLINYTKSGQPFWNMFSLAPVYGNDGKVRYFVGVQLDVSSKDMTPPSCALPPDPTSLMLPAEPEMPRPDRSQG